MLSEIKPGTKIFIDSNIFIYHFLGINENSSAFFQRCEQKEIIGLTSTIVIAEIWHRLMIAEAIEIYNISPAKAVFYLKSHPAIVKELTKCHSAINSIPKMQIKIYSLSDRTFSTAQLIIKQYGLLTNDALNLALMKNYKIKNIATNDKDFKLIKDITIYKP